MHDTEEIGKKALLYCSFCAKGQHEVAKLFAGSGVFICGECVDLFHQLMHEEAPPVPE